MRQHALPFGWSFLLRPSVVFFMVARPYPRLSLVVAPRPARRRQVVTMQKIVGVEGDAFPCGEQLCRVANSHGHGYG
jgi:hypothetical protein